MEVKLISFIKERKYLIFILAVLHFILTACHISDGGASILYVFNNSKYDVLLKGFQIDESTGDKIKVYETSVLSNELECVADLWAGKIIGDFFLSDILEVYVVEKKIYSLKRNEGILYRHSYKIVYEKENKHGADPTVFLVAPLFKWCGDKLCDDQKSIDLEEEI